MQGVIHILLPEFQGDIHYCQRPFLHILHDKVSAMEPLVYEPSVGHTCPLHCPILSPRLPGL